MLPQLPVELYVQILRSLPAKEPSTISTISSFLAASTSLRAIALEATIWENLYRARYPNCDEANEAERRERLHGDVRLMFIERHKADRKALHLLDFIRTEPVKSQERASRELQEISFDVWDVLEPETLLPVPKVFRNPATDDMDEEAAPQALPRRFWAKAMRGAIARRYAVKLWTDMRERPEEHTFDDVLLGFSAFLDYSPKESIKQLDAFAAFCRHRLSNMNVQLDPDKADYKLSTVVLAIRAFLQERGFAVDSDSSFLDPLSQFPHHILSFGRCATLPMSINWVFAAICRRLGIQAGPTNTPGKVLCHITSHNPQHGDMLLDVCTTARPIVFSSRDAAVMLAEAGMPGDLARADAVLPAELTVMLRRAAYNIFNVTRTGHVQFGESGDIQRRADYAASVAIAATSDPQEARGVRQNGGFFQAVPQPPPGCPLDIHTVIAELPNAADRAPDNGQMFGVSPLARRITDPPKRRPYPDVDGFVGQVTPIGPELGCVFGWEWVEREDGTPTYTSYIVCGVGVIPHHFGKPPIQATPAAPLTTEGARRLRQDIVCFDQYFEDAVVPREDGLGGRLVPSQEVQAVYPDDLEYGARWTAEVLEEAAAREAAEAN